MADEDGHSGTSTSELELVDQSEDNGELNSDSFIFTSSSLPNQTMQALVTSVPSSVFSLEDITTSAVNGDTFCYKYF